MNNAELEAAADKTAFPWSCIICTKTFHYAKQWRAKVSWGDVCIDCLPESSYQKDVHKAHKSETGRVSK